MPRSALARHLLDWFHSEGNARHFPWRIPGTGPWHVLMAEILLRQTNADRVVPVYQHIVRRAPSPHALCTMHQEELETILQPLGLFRQRAQGLKQLAQAVVDRHGGVLPRTLQELQALPHVGPYAAGAVVVFALGGRAPLPDVNVTRVGSRYYGVPAPRTKKDKLEVAKKVLNACPKGLEREFHYALLDFAQKICTPRPKCEACPLRRGCRHIKSLGQKAGH